MTHRPDAILLNNRWTHRTRFVWIAALFAILLAATAVYAQSLLYGTLTGTVTDTSGAVVPGATVTAQETQTGVAATATTDSDGIYRFTNLQPGSYKVTIAAKGFQTQETSGVQVTINTVTRQNAQLKVATATQQVIVTTQAPILQTDNADVHTDITSQQIEDLPTFGTQGRNFQSLLIVVPGAGLPAETNSQAGNPQRAINAISMASRIRALTGASMVFRTLIPGCPPMSPTSRRRMRLPPLRSRPILTWLSRALPGAPRSTSRSNRAPIISTAACMSSIRASTCRRCNISRAVSTRTSISSISTAVSSAARS